MFLRTFVGLTPRTELQEVTKVVVGIHVLPTGWLFVAGIPRS